MEAFGANIADEFKPNLDLAQTICRCCLNTERRVYNISIFVSQFHTLAGLNVSDSDGLPPWICYECGSLLSKAVRFKKKMLQAHTMLCDYLMRCAPFPIDAQDTELSKYASPHLAETVILNFDNNVSVTGYHQPLEHEKQITNSPLNEIVINPSFGKAEDPESVKQEGFSDYEDNLPLEEFRSNAQYLNEIDLTIEPIVSDPENIVKQENLETKEVKKKKKHKKKESKIKKKRKEEEEEPIQEPKTTIRKQIELDPTKIRIITLDPEEQFKQRQEDTKSKFPFQCHLCYKGFNFDSKLENHMKKHSPSRGKFECTLCSMFFPTTYSHSVHMRIHTMRYECVQCGRRMTDRASIFEHYRSQHEGLMTHFTCHLCGKVSNNGKTHRGHMRNHHSGQRPSCSQCGHTFINQDSLKEHMQIHEGIKNYECSECGKRFRTRTQIKHHQLKHTDVKEFYCVECDVRFKSSHTLRQHLLKSKKHRDVQSFHYLCVRCDKRFDTSRALQHHSLIQHEGLRPHPCPDCPASLASKNSLAKHQHRVHGGARPPRRHVCDACGKAFRGKSVLINHVRTHTGEKPYECETCGRKFAQRTAMKTHVKLVHLKIRRRAKEKPEVTLPTVELFSKEEPTLVFDAWRHSLQPAEMYCTVTAGP